jgi:ABC-type dipeptide/oligopeptide/nickel transport system permease subunit
MTKSAKWKRSQHRPTIWFSLLVMLVLGLVAALAPWIAPHDPYEWSAAQSSLPPMWVHGTSNPGKAEYPLGTDRYGRDLLSREIYGARTALVLALTAVPLAAVLGTLIGLTAGYAGGQLGALTMLFTEMISSLPSIMFVVIIVLIFRSLLPPTWLGGLITLVIGFAAISWVSLARLIRINALQIKAQLFVEAAISIGASPWRIIRRHLLPNVAHVILVWIVISIPAVILLEAILGYIGVGVTAAVDGSEFTAVSWGGLFFSGRSMLSSNPLVLVIPSLCILLISMSFLLLGDFLNETSRPGRE